MLRVLMAPIEQSVHHDFDGYAEWALLSPSTTPQKAV